MSLSIVIPTTASRASIFKTIESVHGAIQGLDVIIEVVVNRLRNNENILEQLDRDKRIVLRFHNVIHDTAESSAMWAAYTSPSDWVWLLGDDDLATNGSVEHILQLTSKDDISFWLLNVLLVFEHTPLEYYRIGPKPVQVSEAIALWQKCGFFSVLTTISCFLLKRSSIDIDLFEEFHAIQGVYSHSFALLAMLNTSQVGVTDFFCVIRNEENSEKIEIALSQYAKSRGIELNSIWTTGAQKLFELLSEKIEVPVSKLLQFREIELIKDVEKTYVRNTDIQILVSDSKSVMDRASKILVSQNLIFDAPVRISLCGNAKISLS